MIIENKEALEIQTVLIFISTTAAVPKNIFESLTLLGLSEDIYKFYKKHDTTSTRREIP